EDQSPRAWRREPEDDRTALIFLGQAAPPQFPLSDAYSSPQILLAICNTSLLIDYCCGEEDGRHYYMIIDVGKSFREQVLHAIHGLDDIRSLQPRGSAIDTNPLPVFLSQFTMERLKRYLDGFHSLTGESSKRIVTNHSLPRAYLSRLFRYAWRRLLALGFLFGNKSKVAYISDISRIPPSTEYAISKAGAGQLDLLILDTNVPSMVMRGRQPTHLCLPERRMSKRALLTGMTHYFDHHEYNEILAEWSLRKEFSSACPRRYSSLPYIILDLRDNVTITEWPLPLPPGSVIFGFDSCDEKGRRCINWSSFRRIDCVLHGVASVKTFYVAELFMHDLGESMEFDLEIMCRHAIDIRHFGTDYLLKYISDRSGNLRSLKLAKCYSVTDHGFERAVVKLPLLEDLEVSYCLLSEESLKVVGQSCHNLKTLKLNRRGLRRPRFENDDEALAIAETLHGLRHLQLFGNSLSNTSLSSILDNCPYLEHLDLRQCFNHCWGFGKEVFREDQFVRYPSDSTHDYPFDATRKWYFPIRRCPLPWDHMKNGVFLFASFLGTVITEFSFSEFPSLTPEMERRNSSWAELPTELTSSILQRLGAIEVLETLRKCVRHGVASLKTPAMWRKIVMHNVKTWGTTSTSCTGGLVEIEIWDFGTDSLVNYIADSSGNLRTLNL
ncbi:LOW QUALITY PROTEIN: hypothetical protein HID58_057761, partial [Brassica napus]